ncbi:MAG TPA: hypothetical protein VIU12_02530 [Chryseolinea sp.]
MPAGLDGFAAIDAGKPMTDQHACQSQPAYLREESKKMEETDKIELHGANNRRGPTFPKGLYDTIANAILDCAAGYPDGTVAFDELLDQVGKAVSGVLPWHILQVKVDLQERRILSVSYDRDRRQIIKLNARGRRLRRALS